MSFVKIDKVERFGASRIIGNKEWITMNNVINNIGDINIDVEELANILREHT